jgi:hypothetical protein
MGSFRDAAKINGGIITIVSSLDPAIDWEKTAESTQKTITVERVKQGRASDAEKPEMETVEEEWNLTRGIYAKNPGKYCDVLRYKEGKQPMKFFVRHLRPRELAAAMDAAKVAFDSNTGSFKANGEEFSSEIGALLDGVSAAYVNSARYAVQDTENVDGWPANSREKDKYQLFTLTNDAVATLEPLEVEVLNEIGRWLVLNANLGEMLG